MNAYVDLTTQSGIHGAKPFLKWVGGKRSLLPQIGAAMPQSFNRYFEPFVGGGAVFWDMLSKQNRLSGYHINDANADLTTCYRVIRDDVESLIDTLESGDFQNDESCFYVWRNLDRDDSYTSLPEVIRAARFIFLNRICFNGLCRYNAKGQFNASFGRYTAPFAPDVETLRHCAKALNEAEVTVSTGCFSALLDEISEGDFVYLDPPYVPHSATADFTGYTAQKFDWQMQTTLLAFCEALTEKGAFFLQSNASAEFTHALYDDFHISEIDAARRINCKADRRGPVKEVLIQNY